MKEVGNFGAWLETMTDTIASWTYYADFPKAQENVEKIKVPLNILNALIGSKNIEEEFLSLLGDYPEILKAIPILIAKRMNTKSDVIIIKDPVKDYFFDFRKREYTDKEYALFMKKTGIFNLLENHLVANLYDYVTGVEVGLDSHGRKNRTGDAMEDLIQGYLENQGFTMNQTLFKEMKSFDIERKFNVNLSPITNNGKTVKKFDFVVKGKDTIYLIETNFYSSQGSKLNETARSYKMIAEETKSIKNVEFVWFTDGQGWEKAKRNLQETFEVMEHIYNLNDLKNGILDSIK